MLKIIIYGLLMFGLGYLAKCIEKQIKKQEIKHYAEIARMPNETIETYSATILTDENGNVSWFRNDNINIIKIKKKDEEK